MRYANNSQYKNDTMIRKEVTVSPAVIDELKRIIDESEVSWSWSGHIFNAYRLFSQVIFVFYALG